jgi:hypothetical protein
MSTICEAEAMDAGLQGLGVKAERIVCEPNARTTMQNAVETFKILNDMALQEFCRITLVVEPFQAIRALRAFHLVRERSKFYRDYTIELAPAKRLPIAQGSVYVYVTGPEQRFRGRGWTPALDTYLWRGMCLEGGDPEDVLKPIETDPDCVQNFRKELERSLNEKLKLGNGH